VRFGEVKIPMKLILTNRQTNILEVRRTLRLYSIDIYKTSFPSAKELGKAASNILFSLKNNTEVQQ